ncbi:hypothetical protein MBLNU230_g3135t1 [Neophaeotheca triangularis]
MSARRISPDRNTAGSQRVRGRWYLVSPAFWTTIYRDVVNMSTSLTRFASSSFHPPEERDPRDDIDPTLTDQYADWTHNTTNIERESDHSSPMADQEQGLDTIPLLDSGGKAHLALQAVFESQKRVTSLRESLLHARLRAATEMQKMVEKARHVEESVTAIVATFSLQEEENMRRTPPNSFISIQRQLQTDKVTLTETVQAAVECQSRVSTLEYEIGQEEERFDQAFKELIDHIPNGRSLHAAIPEVNVEEDHAANPDSNIPVEARHLFAKIGELRLLEQERLDVEDAHAIAESDRQFARDQDREPSESDSEFERLYLDHMTSLQHRVHQAEAQVASSRLLCEPLNLDLDTLRYTRPPQEAFEHPTRSLLPEHAASPKQQIPGQVEGDLPAGAEGNIQQWLDTVSEQDERQGPPSDPGSEVKILSTSAALANDVQALYHEPGIWASDTSAKPLLQTPEVDLVATTKSLNLASLRPQKSQSHIVDRHRSPLPPRRSSTGG